jgi:hypothetical protein
MNRKAAVVLAVVFGLIVLAIINQRHRPVPFSSVQRATDSPCGSVGHGDYYVVFPMDADAGSTYGRGWVKMYRCAGPDDRAFVQHFGTGTPFVLLTDSNAAPYLGAMKYAQDRGRVIKVK